jgi:hypothetical protein
MFSFRVRATEHLGVAAFFGLCLLAVHKVSEHLFEVVLGAVIVECGHVLHEAYAWLKSERHNEEL